MDMCPEEVIESGGGGDIYDIRKRRWEKEDCGADV